MLENAFPNPAEVSAHAVTKREETAVSNQKEKSHPVGIFFACVSKTFLVRHPFPHSLPTSDNFFVSCAKLNEEEEGGNTFSLSQKDKHRTLKTKELDLLFPLLSHRWLHGYEME